jgi:hypothetical protein
MLKMLKLSKLAKRLGMATTIGRLAVTHPPAYRESNPWGAANLFAVKILRSHSFRDAEIPASLMQPQEDLLRRAEQARGSMETDSRSGFRVRDSLKAQSEDLRKKAAAADGANADALKTQLLDTQNRLSQLEKEGRVAETIVQKYGPSVCLLHIVVGFVDKESGQPLQVAVDANGEPLVDEKGMAQLDVGGRGPRLQIDAFGTGFHARPDGTILTNHHVAEPWWHDDELKQLLDQGADPRVLSYEAYFPGKSVAIRAELGRISSEADVATLKLETPPALSCGIARTRCSKRASQESRWSSWVIPQEWKAFSQGPIRTWRTKLQVGRRTSVRLCRALPHSGSSGQPQRKDTSATS